MWHSADYQLGRWSGTAFTPGGSDTNATQARSPRASSPAVVSDQQTDGSVFSREP